MEKKKEKENHVALTSTRMILLQSGSDSEKEIQLRAEIKQLLKEASSMSQ